MNSCPLSHDELAQEKHLREVSKRIGNFIAEFEMAQEKVETWQNETSAIIRMHQQSLNAQLASVEKQSNTMAELMTDTGAARFRVATELHVKQSQIQIDNLNSLFKKQQYNFEVQQKKIDEIVSTHLLEMKKAEQRVAFKIQNFIERLNVEEMKEMADTARQAIEESSSSAIYQSRKFLQRFHWKNIALILFVVTFNTLAMGLYLGDEMPWEVHQHSMQERLAGQALLNAWPSLTLKVKHDILAHSKKATHKVGS